MPTHLPTLEIPNAMHWRQWLARHGSESAGAFLTIVKEGRQTSTTSLTYQQALDEALCYGWIDSGGGGKLDDVSYSFRFTPRRSKSSFSARNVGFVERLEREGRMQPSGRAAVDSAKAGGRWGVVGGSRRRPPSSISNSIADEGFQRKAATKANPKRARAASRPKLTSDSESTRGRLTRSGRPAPSYKE